MPRAGVTYFLADVHLSPEQPAITAAFCKTLTALARDADAVYILGDLFDYWLGDALVNDFQLAMAAAIAALPCPVYYQHGNRDFLLGEAFAARAQMTILPERHIITLDGKRVLLEHGDLLCTDDKGYQRLRRVLRSPVVQRLYFALPAALKQRLARGLRRQSGIQQAKKADFMIDTNRAEIARVMAHFAVDVVVHGHTHRPKKQIIAHKPVYVLGDFRPQGQILRVAGGAWRLISSQ